MVSKHIVKPIIYKIMITIDSIKNSIKVLSLLVLTTLSSAVAFAQDVPEKVDVNINSDGGGSVWYGL